MKSSIASKFPKPDRAASPTSRLSRQKRAIGDMRTHPLYLQSLLASNVRLVRVARGLSQEELADRASLDRTYISSIERRLRNVSIQNIQRLALALQVDPRELLDPDLINDARYLD